jgi:hypothetical protein
MVQKIHKILKISNKKILIDFGDCTIGGGKGGQFHQDEEQPPVNLYV